MIIKVLLIGFVLLIVLWFLSNRSKAHARAGIKLIALSFAALAVTAILFPGLATDVANTVGVGRGADLVLYLLTTFFLFFILSYYIRSNDEQRKIVTLARKIAIIEANQKYDKDVFHKNYKKYK